MIDRLHSYLLDGAAELDLPLTVPAVADLAQYVARRRSDEAPASPQMTIPPQQRSVLIGLARGETLQETAHRMVLSQNTVKTHRAWLYRTLGARTGAQAVAIAIELRLISPTVAGAR
ncbi:response regulator transcription factor [Streptomyces albidoflavus]|uniref:response regulator transcription factor n=1 Tax=Micromonospora aurantiaca (nom. illeg.) TaxID=47850 RepID=UPI0036618301